MRLLALAILCVLGLGEIASAHRGQGHRHFISHGTTDARPSAWCGWFARHNLVTRDPGIAFNLARNWAHWGHPGAPSIGAIVVWPHHVGKIVGRDDRRGLWIIESGNDGHAVRTRPRSIAGAIAIRARCRYSTECGIRGFGGYP